MMSEMAMVAQALAGQSMPAVYSRADLASLAATPYRLYVAPGGADANPGTEAAPLRTIARAAQLAVPGTTVYVAPGRYAGGFTTRASGAAGARIYYVSTRRWGAVIVPPAPSHNDTAWDNRGSHVDIVGFEVDGSAAHGGVAWTHGIYHGGSDGVIRANRVHHLALGAPCTSAGGSAIGIDGYYRGSDSYAVGNLVHDIGPATCRYVHGIYVSTTGRVSNNIVYRVAGAGIHLWHDARAVLVAHNTVAGSGVGIVVGGGDRYYFAGGNDHTVVANNITYDNQLGIVEQGHTGPNNRFLNNLSFRNRTADWRLKQTPNCLAGRSADPLFLAYAERGMPDFRLRASSPARARASAGIGPAYDVTGQARPADGEADIGAFQYQSGTEGGARAAAELSGPSSSAP